jgi:hypothetical protein
MSDGSRCTWPTSGRARAPRLEVNSFEPKHLSLNACDRSQDNLPSYVHFSVGEAHADLNSTWILARSAPHSGNSSRWPTLQSPSPKGQRYVILPSPCDSIVPVLWDRGNQKLPQFPGYSPVLPLTGGEDAFEPACSETKGFERERG